MSSARGGPLPRPTKILCVGRNYLAHARELGNDVPAEPLFFLKPPSALLGPGEAIILPPGAGRVDFEGEIAFVVGRRARKVAPGEAWDVLSHVLPFNDVTARELQRSDSQWTRAKGFDTFAPAGEPVSLDEVRDAGLDPGRLRIETRVNGALRQEGSMDELTFPVPELVAWISGVMTLEPGDLLATGTPEGVGALAPGDRVHVRIPGVGELENPVRAAGEA
jgi:2-keto-4-pentenoate hydratase/2-oxohepta-3-ene-1,7-dioic acid hydratase in catechol pathway